MTKDGCCGITFIRIDRHTKNNPMTVKRLWVCVWVMKYPAFEDAKYHPFRASFPSACSLWRYDSTAEFTARVDMPVELDMIAILGIDKASICPPRKCIGVCMMLNGLGISHGMTSRLVSSQSGREPSRPAMLPLIWN